MRTRQSRSVGGELKSRSKSCDFPDDAPNVLGFLASTASTSFDSSLSEDAGLLCMQRLCSSPARCPAFVMQMGGTKCLFDNVQSKDKKAFTETVKLIHKAERQ